MEQETGRVSTDREGMGKQVKTTKTKATYSRPSLVEYGGLAKLTRSGTGSGSDFTMMMFGG